MTYAPLAHSEMQLGQLLCLVCLISTDIVLFLILYILTHVMSFELLHKSVLLVSFLCGKLSNMRIAFFLNIARIVLRTAQQ